MSKLLTIYSKNVPSMKNYCRTFLKTNPMANKEDFIDEIIQEGYLKLYSWVNSAKYKEPDIKNEENYVFPFILKSVMMNHLTSVNQKGFISKEQTFDQSKWVEFEDMISYNQGIEEEIDKQILTDMITEMSDNQILAFQLNKQGYKDYEIQNVLDIKNKGTVRVTTRRGKEKVEKLRETL